MFSVSRMTTWLRAERWVAWQGAYAIITALAGGGRWSWWVVDWPLRGGAAAERLFGYGCFLGKGESRME
jgi:hypothetical protein